MPINDELEEKVGQAYQVIGILVHHIQGGSTNLLDGDFESALDYFSDDGFDPEFLPWPKRTK